MIAVLMPVVATDAQWLALIECRETTPETPSHRFGGTDVIVFDTDELDDPEAADPLVRITPDGTVRRR